MFTLKIEAESQYFYDFLTKESSKIDDFTYNYSSLESAAKSISRYVFFYIREEMISEFINSNKINRLDKENFILYISSKDIINVLSFIQKKLSDYLLTNQQFHLEGFISFRLKNEIDMIDNILKHALDDFHEYNQESSNITSLKQILLEHDSTEELMFIVINNHEEVILRGDKKIYFIDTIENEDSLLSHLIINAPKEVHVYEQNHTLSPETVLILKELFKEKVEFFNGTYSPN